MPAATSLANLAGAISSRRITPSGLTRDYLNRIRDSHLQAVVLAADELALSAAAATEVRQSAGETCGALAGLGVLVKETLSVEGLADSAASSLELPDTGVFPPQGDLVSRIIALDGVILGKTRATEFAFAQHNLRRGMPVNPVNPELVTGGSSSGSAVAVAAGLCSFAVGSDTGGSVRAPAAFCGIAGWLPGSEAWQHDGLFPLDPALDRIGLFARTVADLTFLAAGLSGKSVQGGLTLNGLKLGIPDRYFLEELDETVKESFLLAVHKLGQSGVEFIEFSLPPMDVVERYYSRNLPQSLIGFLGEGLVTSGLGRLDPVTRARLEPHLAAAQDPVSADELAAFAAACRSAVSEFHAWLVPTAPAVPVRRQALTDVDAVLQWQARASRNTRPVNLMGVPAVTLPIPSPEGAPVGLQVVGSSPDDGRLLAAAAAIEQCI